MLQTKPAKRILKALAKFYPQGVACALDHSNPLELLIATMLSAQCTDERVNIITPALFKRFKNVQQYAQATPKDVEQFIRTAGLFRSKAKNIVATAQMIVERFSGKVPQTMEELIQLPGVARKTANVVLHNAFGLAYGIAVDTHVKRISMRLGLSESDDPKHIEQDLMAIFDRKTWGDLNHMLVQYGRDVCNARKPRCTLCVLRKECGYFSELEEGEYA